MYLGSAFLATPKNLGKTQSVASLYLPSSAGSSPVTPSFHSSWLTIAGTRFASPLQVKSGSGMTALSGSWGALSMLRQYIVPLGPLAPQALRDEPLYGALSLGSLIVYASLPSGGAQRLRVVHRVVDAAGNTYGPADHTATITFTSGSATITAPGGTFTADDVYRTLRCPIGSGNYGEHVITAVASSSSATMDSTAGATETDTIPLKVNSPLISLSDSIGVSPLAYDLLKFTDDAFDIGFSWGLATLLQTPAYLVIEIGTNEATPAGTTNLTFGDLYDPIAAAGDAPGKSTGGSISYYPFPAAWV